MRKVEIGYPLEYEDEEGICHYGLFIRENERELLENKLQELQRKDKETMHLKNELECYENGLYFSSEVEELQDKLDRKDNIINELKEWLEEQHQFIIEIPAFTKEISQEHKTMELCYENVLDKIEELENDL